MVNKAFQHQGAVSTTGSTASDGNGKLEQVRFGAGKSGTTVSGGLVRGDRDTYILNAQSGQRMDLSISSLEDNAVFEVIDPSGTILGSELKSQKIALPSTGDYQIVVGEPEAMQVMI